MRHAILIAAVALLVALFFLTPWRYDHAGQVLIRTHRITGQSQRLDYDGWQTIEARAESPVVQHPSEADTAAISY